MSGAGTEVQVAGLRLRSPVLVAAGCGGTGRELAAYAPLADLGAFTTRTVTSDPRPGAPAGRVVESPSGLVHATGLPNPGLDHFLATELPGLVAQDVRVVVSLAVTSAADASALARRLARAPGVSAVELALAPPGGHAEDPDEEDLFAALEPHQAAGMVGAVARELPPGLPVWAKVRNDPDRVVAVARACVDAGAGAVVVGDGLSAVLPDGRAGGLGGPAVRPVALACVRRVVAALPHVDVVGVGGVATPTDVRAFLDAGARAVGVGTALLHDPTTAARLAAALREETR
ncbi:Dihydroorotate dehydrogenase B (NAD(+)), catalytic subunit [Nocardioides aquaticus]|uniref:Dihydroorotate dehydrogenase B (NAD(+)), catalytic subunit n=1 Tax=Nocardioides aquaticus TaxID=160826 RepID=A0ABX8EIN0_9ACTN|nr:hypothetical protein [Nocardioides aquaticus]QVT80346.1 Dihydroorotate dehydrogenase B (NAD(+)), catalytic subunit [Nocardioides aquaticus]